MKLEQTREDSEAQVKRFIKPGFDNRFSQKFSTSSMCSRCLEVIARVSAAIRRHHTQEVQALDDYCYPGLSWVVWLLGVLFKGSVCWREDCLFVMWWLGLKMAFLKIAAEACLCRHAQSAP